MTKRKADMTPEELERTRAQGRKRRAMASPEALERERLYQIEYMKSYLPANRASARARAKAWYAGNTDRARESATGWTKKNRETVRLIKAKWQAANPGPKNACTSQRRAKKLNATPQWLTAEQLAEMRALYTSAKQLGHHVDHIVPLRGKHVSGLHVPWNLQTLPPSENYSKGNRHHG